MLAPVLLAAAWDHCNELQEAAQEVIRQRHLIRAHLGQDPVGMGILRRQEVPQEFASVSLPKFPNFGLAQIVNQKKPYQWAKARHRPRATRVLTKSVLVADPMM